MSQLAHPLFAGLLCLLIALTGCQSNEELVESSAQPSESISKTTVTKVPLKLRPRTDRVRGLDYIFYADDTMRPAYQVGGPLGSLKADGGPVREAFPERFAITEPPPAGTRAMAEWEPMKAMVMSVPQNLSDYDGAGQTITMIAYHSLSVAEVWFVVSNTATQNNLVSNLLNLGISQQVINDKVRFLTTTIDSVWFIDSGPLPIVNDDKDTFAFADFRYYYNRPYDDGVPTVLGRGLLDMGLGSNAVTYRMPSTTEGGTFQATTDGICFTGTRQLYNMSCEYGGCDNSIEYQSLEALQTNPYALELQEVWAEYLGCKDTIVTYSVTDDGTGHLDMYLKVASDDLVIVGDYATPYTNNAQSLNDERLQLTADFIEGYVKPGGTSFNVKRLVMPGHRSTNGGSVPFTYINSTIINGLNLWPATQYNDWVDSRDLAQAQWDDAMPDHEHIWIDATELSFWSGAIHCITRTVPDLEPGLWVEDGACGEDANCAAPADGYDAACYPTSYTSEAICYGPQWLCNCYDCDACGPPVTAGNGGNTNPGGGDNLDPCGGITYEGCCDGNQLQWCENGEVETQNCNNSCGWSNNQGFYNCGANGEDPSGDNPRSCDALTCEPSCDDKECGDDGCGGSCGGCDNGSICNASGQCETCEPACDGKQCGGDGCGGSCGTCGDELICSEDSTCITVPDPCNGLTYEGCCDGLVLTWCEDDAIETINCEDSCGWNDNQGFFNCNAEGPDPSGTFPLECSEASCTPDCSGKTCGDDGCGGICGVCVDEATCVAGQCEAPECIPSCGQWICGSDGCGGSCGSCLQGQLCLFGQCVGEPACEPTCDDKQCGDDGCGGSCGACGPDATCDTSGQCVALPCEPGCQGLSCGDDGCGGSCGTCADTEVCTDLGQCVDAGTCESSCDGKQCGSDGCGGSCGACGPDEACDDANQCIAIPTCEPSCAGKSCGDDGCGGSCGTCDAGLSCDADGQCIDTTVCTPQCDGKVCGDDGCGGSCGPCQFGQTCGPEGQCIDDGACTASCEDKACGDDGCGGSCGACADDESCSDTGQCISDDCIADCRFKVCGDDGCGGSCGSCAPTEGCVEGICELIEEEGDTEVETPGEGTAEEAPGPFPGEVADPTGSSSTGNGIEADPSIDSGTSGQLTSGGCQGSSTGTGTPLVLLLALGVLGWRRHHRRHGMTVL